MQKFFQVFFEPTGPSGSIETRNIQTMQNILRENELLKKHVRDNYDELVGNKLGVETGENLIKNQTGQLNYILNKLENNLDENSISEMANPDHPIHFFFNNQEEFSFVRRSRMYMMAEKIQTWIESHSTMMSNPGVKVLSDKCGEYRKRVNPAIHANAQLAELRREFAPV